MSISVLQNLGTLIFSIINITLEIWVIFGAAFKSVLFILEHPFVYVSVNAFLIFFATVLSDTAFDSFTWGFVQGWWSLVKLTRSALGIKKHTKK